MIGKLSMLVLGLCWAACAVVRVMSALRRAPRDSGAGSVVSRIADVVAFAGLCFLLGAGFNSWLRVTVPAHWGLYQAGPNEAVPVHLWAAYWLGLGASAWVVWLICHCGQLRRLNALLDARIEEEMLFALYLRASADLRETVVRFYARQFDSLCAETEQQRQYARRSFDADVRKKALKVVLERIEAERSAPPVGDADIRRFLQRAEVC